MTRHCEGCGARNPADAAWCSQCYATFQTAPPSSPTLTTDPTPTTDPTLEPGGSPAPAASPDAAAPPTPAGDGADRAVTARDVREREGIVEWRCRGCDAWSGLLETACHVCGRAREGFGDTAAGDAARRQVDPTVVLVAGSLLPGAGHLLVGRVGPGLARVLLAVLWLAGGVALLRGGAGAVLPGAVLVLGAVVLWATSVLDTRVVAAGRGTELLTARRLGLLVITVTVLVLLGAAVALPTS